MKLKSKTSLLMALVVTIPLSVMSWFSLGQLEDSLRHTIHEEMQTLADAAAQSINHFLKDCLEDAQAVALNLPQRALENKDAAQVEQYFRTMMGVFPKFANGMFLLDDQGVLWADSPVHPGTRGTSFAFREYFQRTMQEQKGIMGRPYRSERSGQPVATFTALLRGRDHKVLGMLGCSVPLATLGPLDLLGNLRVGQQGYYYIFDSTRMIIAHPSVERVLERDIPLGANKLFDAAIVGFEGVGETVNSRGVPMLLAVKHVRGTDWMVIAQKPVEEALAPLQQARLRLLASIAVGTILAVAAGILAVRRITQPLLKLRQATHAWGGSGFSEQVAAVAGGDEIGDLARAFQDMGSRLGQSMATLEAAGREWERTFDSVPDAVFLLDLDYRIRRLNRAAAKLVGQEPARAAGLPCYQLMHGSQEPPAHCPHLETMQSGREARAEVEEPHLGGQFELSTTPLIGENGLVEGSVYIVRDITARKKAERALSESEERYRSLVECANELIAVVQDGRVVFANAAASGLLGWSPEEMIGQASEVFYHPEDLPMVMERYRRRMTGEAMPGIFSTRMVTKHGQVKWVEMNSHLVEWSGRPAVQVVFRDVTDRKNAEEALQQSEGRYRSLVENVPFGLCITDMPSGRFLFLNRTVCEMFGYTVDEGLGKTIWDITDPTEHARMGLRVKAHLEGDRSVAIPAVYSGLRKDGSRLRYEVTVSMVTYQGRPALQGIVRDITSQEMLERQLQQAQKMEAVGTLAGGVAHEFNNILMAIRGYTQLLVQIPDLPPKASEYLAKVDASTKRAADLTYTMLSFSRQETGQRQAVRVNDVVEEVRALLAQTLPPHIELALEVELDLPLVLANHNHLEQVVLNLAINARDAMEKGGRLAIGTGRATLDQDFCEANHWANPGLYVVIEVRDTGSGMTPEVLEHIFEPFFTTKDPGRGTGLGLALAYTMIGSHGGGMVVQSLAGQGTSFKVYLPASLESSAADDPSPEKLSPRAGQGQRLLVVDDESAVREVAREALEHHGYLVQEAGQGQEALELYAQALEQGQPFDLVLLDLAMPVMDGEKCLEGLLRMDPGARVLMATGHGGERAGMEWLEGRAVGMLRKPFDLNTLLEQVARLLAPRV